MRINGQGLGYANKTICRKTLENGAGVNCYLRSDVTVALGGNDLGLECHGIRQAKCLYRIIHFGEGFFANTKYR